MLKKLEYAVSRLPVHQDWKDYVIKEVMYAIENDDYSIVTFTDSYLMPVGMLSQVYEWYDSEIYWEWMAVTPFIALSNGEKGSESLRHIIVSSKLLT